MNTQSENIGWIELESIFQLTASLKKDCVDAWKGSIIFITTSLKELERSFMLERDAENEPMSLKEEEDYGILFTKNTDALLLYK